MSVNKKVVGIYEPTDKQGCKDHPLFTRMNDFYIKNCKESNFNAFDFKDEKGKK